MTDAPPEPVARLLQAANDHDTDAFLAGFTDDGVVDDWGREFAGADAIRGWSDKEFIGVDVTLDGRRRHDRGRHDDRRGAGGRQRLQRPEPFRLRRPRRPRRADDDPGVSARQRRVTAPNCCVYVAPGWPCA